jgi:hypothetical protein
MQQDLFNNEIPINKDVIEEVNITTTILYMSEQELKLFKTLCKKGIKYLYKDNFQTEGNITDLILYTLNKEYGNL